MSDPLDVAVEETQFKLHEEYAKYPGVLDRIEPDTGEYGDSFKWIFILDEDRGQGEGGKDRETFLWTSRRITPHPKSKAGQFYKELTGKPVVKGERVQLRPLFGTPVFVIFEHKTNDDGDKKEKVFAVKKREF